MAAAVSGFLGFALSKVVDQFWTPISGRESPAETLDVVHVAIDPRPRPTEKLLKPTATKPTTQTQRQNARRNSRRKTSKHAVAMASVELPLGLELASKTRSYSDADPAEISSNASTCGASDDEDEAETEDIGAKEMRLMLERAQEIKRLTKQSRQSKSKSQAVKTKTAKTQPRFPDVRSPIRLQNKTNVLWNWSVHSGFAVDAKVSYRGPRNMRNVFCSAAEAEQLESEELLLELAAQVLADN